MEQELAYMKELLDLMPSAAAVYTEELRLAFCNLAFLDNYGAEGGDPIGKPFLKAGRERYYQISRLPKAAELLQREGTELRDVYIGQRRIYSLLRQRQALWILEVIAPFSATLLPLRQGDGRAQEMILSDKKMKSTLETIHRISGFDSTILITGESGTGKTMLAKYIHSTSRRSDAPFVTINCASIPENLIESELFGYVSGAFTGAGQRGKIGLVETANGGTLFLDEIGTLPLSLQGKFLQLVQEKTYFPVGGIRQKSADVRIISATNQDLNKQVEEGLFREDLYYRLRQHSWSGNIRELQYVIERAMVTSADDCIQAEDIPPLHGGDGGEASEHPAEELSFDQSVSAYEKKLLRRAYQKYGSSYKVAEALGISQSKASRLLRKYHI